MKRIALIACASSLSACPADDAGSDDAAAGSSSTTVAEDSGSTGEDVDLAELYGCEEPELAVLRPLAGPGYDPQTGLVGEPQDSYVMHTTQIMLRPDGEAQGYFFELNDAVSQQLETTAGLVGYSLAIEPTCGFLRTMGVWESEEAMYGFVTSGAHLEAMSHSTEVAITGRVAHATVTPEQLQSDLWPTAIATIAEVAPSAAFY